MMDDCTFDDSVLYVCAVRYALGRMTYVPGLVQDCVKRNVDAIDTNDIKVIIWDISDASRSYKGLGDPDIDAPGWLELKEFLEGVLKRRAKCTIA